MVGRAQIVLHISGSVGATTLDLESCVAHSSHRWFKNFLTATYAWFKIRSFNQVQFSLMNQNSGQE